MADSGQPEAPENAIELYKIAIEEYRFQVGLNWERTQHWFALNAALAGGAIALLRLTTDRAAYALVGGLFLAGVVTCGLALVGASRQHGYYREARDHKGRLEAAMELGDFALRTTRGMGATSKWGFLTLTRGYYVLYAVLGIIDLGGAGYAFHEALSATSAPAETPGGGPPASG